MNEQGIFNASDLEKQQYDLDCPLSSAVRLKNNIVYGYCTCTPSICKYQVYGMVILWSCIILVVVKYQQKKAADEINIAG